MVDVVLRRQQRIELPVADVPLDHGGQFLLVADRRPFVAAGEDGLLLLALVESDQTLCQVIMHWCSHAG